MYDPRFPHPAWGITLAVCAGLCFALLDTITQFVGVAVTVFMAIWPRRCCASAFRARPGGWWAAA